MKPLLVGEGPGPHGDPARPLEGRIGRRLAAFGGWTEAEYLATFERVNILPTWMGSAGKGSAFPLREAKAKAQLMISQRFWQRRFVLLLGKRAAAAMCFPLAGYFEWRFINFSWVAVVPHPSGVNRWYNRAANCEAMRAFMLDLRATIERTQ